jgi:hypothetical protein
LTELFPDNLRELLGYLTPHLVDATRDIGHLSTMEVTDRFVGWCVKPFPNGREVRG